MQGSLLEQALNYASRGWRVFPLSKRSKIPPAGFPWRERATTCVSTITEWFTGEFAGANIGLATGSESGIVAVDIDVRDGKQGIETMQALDAEHGGLPSDTCVGRTASGGYHVLLAYPPAAEHVASRNGALGSGVDIKADGGYIVLPPSVLNTGRYEWIKYAPDLAPLPQWVLGVSEGQRAKANAPSGGYKLPLTQVAELRSALAYIPADERDVWLRVGMALHESGAGEQAYGVWCEWSQKSSKFDPDDQRRTWESFSEGRTQGVTVASIFWDAENLHGWPNPARDAGKIEFSPDVDSAELEPLESEASGPAALPDNLVWGAPGLLSDLTAWIYNSSPKKQAGFALLSALAVCSVAMGRKFVTSERNYSSMYFIAVGKSSCGKEHGKNAIETALSAAGLESLIGGGGYTAPSAILSALVKRPVHIAIIDELGLILSNTDSNGGNSARRGALTTLMELFGRCDGVYRGEEYARTRELIAGKDTGPELKVMRPALTLYGLTTPSTFYAALSSGRVADGFISRFLALETHIGRQKRTWGNPAGVLEFPVHLANWLAGLREPNDAGNLAGVEPGAEFAPEPQLVTIEPGATGIFSALEDEIITRQDELDAEGLAPALGRTVEKAMRVALIAAVASDNIRPTVTAECAVWAAEFVKFCDYQTLASVARNVSDSSAERNYKRLLEIVSRAGIGGITKRDLVQRTRFADRRTRNDMIAQALEAGDIMEQITSPNGRAASVYVRSRIKAT